MKETTKMSRAIQQIETMYREINIDKFDGSLPLPIITVQSSPHAYGHMTVSKVWKRKEDETYELNISAELLSMDIEELLDTLIHEMIHIYCRENSIQDTSRGGAYHNKTFKQLAEEKGLITYKTEKYGYNTTAKDNLYLIEYAINKGWSEIRINRKMQLSFPIKIDIDNSTTPPPATTGTRSNSRKYQCPKCKNSVRATKDVNIICGDCNIQMIIA